MKFWEFWTYL